MDTIEQIMRQFGISREQALKMLEAWGGFSVGAGSANPLMALDSLGDFGKWVKSKNAPSGPQASPSMAPDSTFGAANNPLMPTAPASKPVGSNPLMGGNAPTTTPDTGKAAGSQSMTSAGPASGGPAASGPGAPPPSQSATAGPPSPPSSAASKPTTAASSDPSQNMQMLPSQTPGGTDKTRAMYEWDDPNLNFSDYGKNTFDQSLRDAGGSLSPDSSTNPFADTPYARFFRSRYGQTQPFQQLVDMATSQDPSVNDKPFSQQMQEGQQDYIQGSRPFIGGNQAMSNLNSLADLTDQQYADGGFGTSTIPNQQQSIAMDINSDPYLAAQLVMAQLRDTVGGIHGGVHAQRRLMDAAKNESLPTSVGAADGNGSFLRRLLKQNGQGG